MSLIERINALNPNEKRDVFGILKDNDIPYTKNTNGYFFNIGAANPDAISHVSEFVDMLTSKRSNIMRHDLEREMQSERIRKELEDSNRLAQIERQRAYEASITVSESDTATILIEKIKRPCKEYTIPDGAELHKTRTYPKGSVWSRILANVKETAKPSIVSSKAQEDTCLHPSYYGSDADGTNCDADDADGTNCADDADGTNCDTDAYAYFKVELKQLKCVGAEEPPTSDADGTNCDDLQQSDILKEDVDFYRKILIANGFVFSTSTLLKFGTYEPYIF